MEEQSVIISIPDDEAKYWSKKLQDIADQIEGARTEIEESKNSIVSWKKTSSPIIIVLMIIGFIAGFILAIKGATMIFGDHPETIFETLLESIIYFIVGAVFGLLFAQLTRGIINNSIEHYRDRIKANEEAIERLSSRKTMAENKLQMMLDLELSNNSLLKSWGI